MLPLLQYYLKGYISKLFPNIYNDKQTPTRRWISGYILHQSQPPRRHWLG